MKYNSNFTIGKKIVGINQPTFFIADIAANHDGDLKRAIELIHIVAEAGADAAKFQHFAAESIVSDHGFKSLGGNQSHQAKWEKSVFDVYKDASVDQSWTSVLKETCDKAGIVFFTSPYSLELVDHVDPYVPAYKIGSGDISWTEIISHISKKGKPVILAAGASTFDDVVRSVNAALQFNKDFALLQCNTNYTASLENFKYIQLNVLKTFSDMFPGMVLGLSDHTPGHTTVLGAVALGARIVEKHFTDDQNRKGPDHLFSMTPATWKEMVHRTRELEAALGGSIKKIEDNESQTCVLQRRSIRLRHDLPAGKTIEKSDLTHLRPCPKDAIPPFRIEEIIGKKTAKSLNGGDYLRWSDLC